MEPSDLYSETSIAVKVKMVEGEEAVAEASFPKLWPKTVTSA